MCTVRSAYGLFNLVAGMCGVLALAWLASCAGVYPSVLVESLSTGRMTLPLDGVYDVTARAPFAGALTARFTARPTEEGFVASTRAGAAWSFVPGLGRLFGPVFAPSLFPDGVILSWWSGLPQEGRPAEGWIGVAGVRSLGLRTRMWSIDQPIELLNRDGKRVGVIEVEARRAADPAATDYKALAAAIGQGVNAHLYDGRLAGSAQTRAYVRQLESVGAKARDDAEFVFGAFLAARNYPRLSTPIMWRRVSESAASPFRGWHDDERSTIRVEFNRSTGIATLRVDAFLDAVEVDRAMRRALALSPRGLIVDLRTCPGVTLASLRVAAWLSGSVVDGPTLAGPTARDRAGPAPVLPLSTPRDYQAIDGELARLEWARLAIQPAGQIYAGPVAVLTSPRTSASAELLVRVLAESGRARIFGQTTAGRPIVSRSLDLAQGWVLWVAAWDAVGLASRAIDPDESCRDAKQKAIVWLSSSN